MGRKKIKIELEDAEGGKYNLSLEGNISREKMLKVFEMMDLLDLESPSDQEGSIGFNSHSHSHFVGHSRQNSFIEQPKMSHGTQNPVSVGSKIFNLLNSHFPYSTFTSSDVLELYEDEYAEPIKLSIISTYLSRYAERGRLVRSKQGKEWVYRLVRQQASSSPSSHHVPSFVRAGAGQP